MSIANSLDLAGIKTVKDMLHGGESSNLFKEKWNRYEWVISFKYGQTAQFVIHEILTSVGFENRLKIFIF